MPTVFIVATKQPENDAALRSNIFNTFPSNYYEIGRGQWLVAFPGTAEELTIKLGVITQAKTVVISGVVVFGIAGYYGVASRDMWEWLGTKLSAAGGQGG